MEGRNKLGRTVRIRATPDVPANPPSAASLQIKHSNGISDFKDSLLQICSRDSTSKPHLGSLLNVLSKTVEKSGMENTGLELVEFFICLRIPLVNENKSVRASALRLIRLCLHNGSSVQNLLQAQLDHFIAKCFDILVDNMAERAQVLRLCRRMVLLDPESFPASLARSIVALALDGSKEKDRLVRASLALLAELCIVNPNVFVNTGGVRCFAAAVLDCSSARMQEAMMSCLLYLLNTEERRRISSLNLRSLIAPYSDYHYKHYIDTVDSNNPSSACDDRELRLLCAKQALLTVLRSWSGLLHVISCRILNDLVQVLLPCHLDTRKAMLEFFYTLLRLPLPDWTDEFTVALLATDPSRVQDAWKLSDGFVALEGKSLLPHVSKVRPNLVVNHTALLVYCLVEARLLQTLVEVIVTSDTFISVRATILLGELLHLSSTLLPPVCHGTKMCLPKLVDYVTSLKSEPIQRLRATQAADALSKIHRLKKKSVTPHSLALAQIVETQQRGDHGSVGGKHGQDPQPAGAETVNGNRDAVEPKTNGEIEPEVCSSRDPDGILANLARDCGVLVQKDPLLWNWSALSNVFLWNKVKYFAFEDCGLRSIVRRVVHFFKPSNNQFCHCELSNNRTRLYTGVGCLLMDFLTAAEEVECDKILADFLDDVSSAIRDISQASSAHDCLFSPGRLATTACQDYFLFIGRLSGTANGIVALEKAGLFQDLLELVASTNHDCYLKVMVSTLDYHTDGYARAILKKILIGSVEGARIYATQHLRVLLRAAAQAGSTATLAKWMVPLLLNQFKDRCRAVVVAAVDILDEATDDAGCIEVLISHQTEFVKLVQLQEEQFLDSRARLLLVKTLSLPAGFKLWLDTESDPDVGKTSLVKLELNRWMTSLNTRYVQLVESDLADGLTQHQRADDGRYGRLSNIRHAIRDLPVPAHLFSQLNQHREGLDFLRTSGQLSKLFAVVISGFCETDDEILELKSAMWAAAHLGTTEAGVGLLESAQVVESFARIASHSPVMALRGTAFFALNLVAMTNAGVNLLSRLGWASIKRHHGELWHIVDDSEWNCLSVQPPPIQQQQQQQLMAHLMDKKRLNPTAVFQRDRLRTVSQSSGHSVTFANDERDPSTVVVTSTPRRVDATTVNCWETDSQPYSLEGSSIHFDSDSEQSDQLFPGEVSSDPDRGGGRPVGRAYTLPHASQSPMGGQNFVAHMRSFSDSHYPPAEEQCDQPLPPSSPTARAKTRIWTKLRTSLRLTRSKRFSLPTKSSTSPTLVSPPPTIQLIQHSDGTTTGSSEEGLSSSAAEDPSSGQSSDEEDGETPPRHFEYPLNRIGSILNRLKSVPYKKRRPIHSSGKTGCFIGLCLPVRLDDFYPPAEWFESQSPEAGAEGSDCSTFNHSTLPLGDEKQYEHDKALCILCSTGRSSNPTSQTDEEKWLVRKELLRLVGNMGSSVGLNANEQGLLRLKQRFPWAFHDVCLFSDVCQVLASYGYRLRARRFLHELFMDSPFDELYALATSRLVPPGESVS